MPNNWKTYKLSEVVKVIDSLHKTPKYSIEGFPMVRAQDITGGNINLKNVIKVSEDVYNDFSKNHKTKIGDLIFSRVGAHCGKVSFVNTTQSFCLGQNTVFIIPEKANNKFIYFLLSSELIQSEIEKTAVVSTYKTISLQTLRNLEINLPPIQEQKSIASILSAIDDKIENNLAINKTLEEMAMALYKHWFVDFGPFKDGEFVESELGLIPKGWEVKSVYDIANYVNGAAFKPSELVDEGKYVIKISELNGGITKNTGKSTKEVKQEQIINDGSVLFSWSATLDIFLWDKGEALLNQHIFNVLPNGSLSIEILYFLLKNIIAHFKAIAADRATTMGHIKLSHLKETFLAIPNEIHKQEFQNEIEPIFSQILENLTENQTLTQLRDTLLPKLISGEVRLKEFRA
jgi:type I restriction enzyme S subunit